MEKEDLLTTVVKYIAKCDNVESDILIKTIDINSYPTDVIYINNDNVLYIANFNNVQIASISHWYEDTISFFYDKKIKQYIILHYFDENKIFYLKVTVTQNGKELEYDANPGLVRIDDLFDASFC